MRVYDMLLKMYRLSVWDHAGNQYLPVFDYNWEISVYKKAREAIDTNIDSWLEDNASESYTLPIYRK